MDHQFALFRIQYYLGLFFYSLLALLKEFCIGLKRKLFNEKLFDSSKLHDDLSGYVCLLSGAAGGVIGHLVIQALARRKCYLIITLQGDSEHVEKIKVTLIDYVLRDVDPSQYRFEYLDMTSFDSIIQLVKKLNNSSQAINFFISNSGVALRDLETTEDGFESQLQINYLGGCLLLIGVFPLLVKTGELAVSNKSKSKIVFTNSCAHKMFQLDLEQLDFVTDHFRANFSIHKMYPMSKMFQLMFNINYFDKMIKGNDLDSMISLINIHPGVIDSGLFSGAVFKKKFYCIFKIMSLMMKRPEEGAINVTTPILSKAKFFDSPECLYLENLENTKIHRDCLSEELRTKLYKKTLLLLKPYIDQFDLPKRFNPS